MAGRTGDPEHARVLYDRAIAIYEELGDKHAAARVWGRWSHALGFTGRRDEALERLEQAYDGLAADDPGEDVAVIAARLSRAYWFLGDQDRAAERAEFALEIAEQQDLPAALAIALRAKSAVLVTRGHRNEGDALLKQALEVALAHDLLEDASTCYFTLSDSCFREDRYADALHYLDQSLALANRTGSRPFQWGAEAERAYALLMLGRWDEALATADDFTEEQVHSGGVVLSVLQAGVEGHCLRGEPDAARRIYEMYSFLQGSTDMQDQGCVRSATAKLRRAEGRLEEALAAGVATIEVVSSMGATFQGVKHGVVDAIDVALELGERAKAEELLAWLDALSPTDRAPWFRAHSLRFRARIAGDAAALGEAAARFRALSLPFWTAVAQLEQAEALGRSAASEPLLGEARATFERLGAASWLERTAASAPAEVVA
jgi:tetratricopeptide (TPR) repeat protein